MQGIWPGSVLLILDPPGLANELLPRVGSERPSPGEGLAERRHFGSGGEHIHILI